MHEQQVPSEKHVRSIMESGESSRNIDGMILGISHAEDGIIPERLYGEGLVSK